MKRETFVSQLDVREIRHFHLFCGLGGGARGFNRAQPRVGSMVGRMRCIGGIDVDPAAIRDFNRLADTSGTVLDLFDRSQYRDFHGVEPPADWKEASVDDIRAAAHGERPHIVFLSAPCKGFSGLLAEGKSKTDRYQALNRLTLRGIWLTLEAWADDPPELLIFENVPRIQQRGRHLLDQIGELLRSYGYAVAETTHNCGEIGGLAQSRQRFLLVARHQAKVPPFLYEPERRPLRSVGQILDHMPLPGDPAAGAMHRVPNLQWKTWIRLAFIEAGADWRSLNRLAVDNGYLSDYLIVPDGHAGAVAGRSGPTNGACLIGDPRPPAGALDYQQYGIVRWDDAMGSVINVKSPGQGTFSVADPRTGIKHNNCFRVVSCDRASATVTSGSGPSAGGLAVADPRGAEDPSTLHGKYPVARWDEFSRTVIAGNANGAYAVADPRMPRQNDKLVALIRSLDGTWHRPFTTLELAALQSLVSPEELWSADPKVQREIRDANPLLCRVFELDGQNDSAWRERIGNAVPPDAAEAIGNMMGQTLLLAWSGETFVLSSTPIWVRPVAVALSVEPRAASCEP